MHNGNPQFSKSKFSVPVGNSNTSDQEWERIFGKRETAAVDPAKRKAVMPTPRKKDE